MLVLERTTNAGEDSSISIGGVAVGDVGNCGLGDVWWDVSFIPTLHSTPSRHFTSRQENLCYSTPIFPATSYAMLHFL